MRVLAVAVATLSLIMCSKFEAAAATAHRAVATAPGP